jgi:MFS transporter, ACS family, hexuronate transporter
MTLQVGNYRWRIVALLFFATTINYIDRQIIGILKPYISGELGWSEADYGFIVTAFQVAYALGLLTTGRFIDKLGTRNGYFWAIVVWSIAAMAHAVARSVAGFAAARFLLGIGQAANFPAAVKTVAEWFPRKERAFATGLFNAGSNFGAITAPIVVSAITVAMGWKWAFIITGAVGFIWIFYWLKSYRVPQSHSKLKKEEYEYIVQDKEENEGGSKIKWVHLFRYKQTYALCATRFISDWVWWFFLFWIPDFLNKTYGVNITEVVLPLIVIYLVSIVGGISGGWVSSRLIQLGKSVDFARKSAILICAFIVVPVIFIYQIQNMWLSVVLIALAAAGHQGWSANMFTLVSDIYPKNAVGSVVGLIGFAGAIGGALSASFIGLLLDSTGSYFLIFSSAASVYLLNWLIIKIGIRKIEPIQFEVHNIMTTGTKR